MQCGLSGIAKKSSQSFIFCLLNYTHLAEEIKTQNFLVFSHILKMIQIRAYTLLYHEMAILSSIIFIIFHSKLRMNRGLARTKVCYLKVLL